MMMVALSPDAQGHLEHYLKQIKTALAGQPSVDPDEVERDVLGHIEVELAGEPQPVPAHRLLSVLDRLGEPGEWVAPDHRSWQPFSVLQERPGDWRLAGVSFGALSLAVALFMGPIMLWPLPPLLVLLSFVVSRIAVAMLEGRAESIGTRGWLIYPALIACYGPIALVLTAGPALLIISLLSEEPSQTWLSSSVGANAWIAVPSAVMLVVGCWWALLGILTAQATGAIRALFRPFAAWLEPRHGRRLAVAGMILAAIAIAALAVPRVVSTAVNAQELTAASPVDPADAILDAFRVHPLVAIADAHGNEQTHALRLALIRDPRIADVVNDIVVEFGTARYQEVLDRFIRGEDVPDDSLRRVWQDTTQIEFDWDLPIYEEFFQAVRAVNASRQPERQLRVVLGDPPIDWERIHGTDGYLARMRTADRDAHAVAVIQREVLAKNHRALIIYGGQHLIRKNAMPNAPDEWARGLVAQLERPGIASVYTINPETRIPLHLTQPDISSWTAPSLARLKGTTLGQMRVTLPTQRPVRAEEQFDAIVYLGPPSAMTTSRLSRALCADQDYMQMRLWRLALIGPPPGAPVTPTDLLDRTCVSR